MITYEFPPGQRPDSTADNFALGFRTTQRDAILFRVDSKLSNDYIEMELVSKTSMCRETTEVFTHWIISI